MRVPQNASYPVYRPMVVQGPYPSYPILSLIYIPRVIQYIIHDRVFTLDERRMRDEEVA